MVWWSWPTTKTAIKRVIKEDRRISREEVGSLSAQATPSERAAAIRRYCDKAEHQDMAGCPPKFQVAYKDHVRAWRAASAVVDSLPDGFLDGFWTGLFNSITRGELDGGLARMEGQFGDAGKGVSNSWHEVSLIAAEYGVVPSD